jgi:hypothetical protein
MIRVIEESATDVLAQTPGVVVRHRLLRDVLTMAPDSPKLQQARADLDESRCVQQLADEQWEDGGWGRFHSRDTRRKQRIPTTEAGVERALSLGLDASHPILQKASVYILAVMQGDVEFPDYHEKNDRWPTGMRLFLASTLSLIIPDYKALSDDRELWYEIARRTFRSGTYNEQDEIDAHAELTGATMKDSYLVLNGAYQLNILGSIPRMLTDEFETALLQWLWDKPDGIGYLGIPLNEPPPTNPGPFDRWLRSLEVLSRLFPTWVRFAQPSIEWLWRQRDERGYWDLGPRPSTTPFLPLSDDWRGRRNRLYDWTTRVLILLRRYHEGIGTPKSLSADGAYGATTG